MATIDNDTARGVLVQTLLEKVRADTYPSNTMLDLIESLLTPEETPAYVVFLQERIRDEQYPSMPMIRRLTKLING